MLRYLSLLLASSLSTTVVAAPVASPEVVVGEQDDIKYEYLVTLKNDDRVQIDGVYVDTAERFRLVVHAGGRVRGMIGTRPVRFSVPPEKRDRLVARLKSGQLVAQAGAGTASRRED